MITRSRPLVKSGLYLWAIRKLEAWTCPNLGSRLSALDLVWEVYALILSNLANSPIYAPELFPVQENSC